MTHYSSHTYTVCTKSNSTVEISMNTVSIKVYCESGTEPSSAVAVTSHCATWRIAHWRHSARAAAAATRAGGRATNVV